MSKRTITRLAVTVLSILLLAFLTLWALQSLSVSSLVDISSGQFQEQKSFRDIVYSQKPQPSLFFDLALKAGLDPKTLPPADWRMDTIKYPFYGLHENTMYHGARSDLTTLAQGWEFFATPDPQRLEQAKLALRILQAQKRFWVNWEDNAVTITPR
jgi:hypothetical protein